MINLVKSSFCLIISWKAIVVLLTAQFFFSCKTHPSKDVLKSIDKKPTVAPESIHFKANLIENYDDGSRGEMDTITGYQKYYYKNGRLRMEGKVTKASPKNYRDGIWSYYNEAGQLMNQETYTKEGKINQLEFMYFINGKTLSSTYQYYEGDFKNKETFRFHKIETLFDTTGKKISQRHWINEKLVSEE